MAFWLGRLTRLIWRGPFYVGPLVRPVSTGDAILKFLETIWRAALIVLGFGLTGIPLAAYEYVVNGKPALEWVMERQCVKTDKASGIDNDANRYAIETVGDPAYPMRLFQRMITVSLETMKIVRGLPSLDIQPAGLVGQSVPA